jgi:tetratricopeptide (TPR) repeat protein/predicted Ser/Thr protein kinase
MSALPPTTAERDERLAGLLSELTEERRRGGRPDVDGMAARHPDLAAELRALWAAAQFADEFTRPSSRPRLTPCQVGAAALPADGTPRVFGDFELLGELGRGGMGVVYKARQVSLNRLVALKMVLRGDLATPADLARFEAEARAAAHLDHPNVVPVYGAGEHDGQAFFSMRYVEGETLAAVLARGPLRPLDAARLLAVIARAVEYAHRRGVLHRDLKPSNVLLGPGGRPLLLDFNLSADAGVAAPHLGGTLPYMAPEHLEAFLACGGAADPPRLDERADLFSLGVILYQLLTGQLPFGPVPLSPSSGHLARFVLERQRQGFVPLRRANRAVDRRLARLVEGCLALSPAARPVSARAVAGALRGQFGLLARLRRWVARRPLATACLTAALALSGTGAGWAGSAILRQARPSADSEYRSGLAAVEAGDLAEAEGRFSEAVRHDEGRPVSEHLFARGLVRMKRAAALTDPAEKGRAEGLFDLAADDLEAAAGQPTPKVDEGQAYACLAYCRGRLRRWGLAIEASKQAIARGAASAEVWNNLAYCSTQVSGEGEEAAPALEKALRLSPDLPAAHYNRAVLACDARKTTVGRAQLPPGALEDIEKALASQPAGGRPYAYACWLYAYAVLDLARDQPTRDLYANRAIDNLQMALARRYFGVFVRDSILQRALWRYPRYVALKQGGALLENRPPAAALGAPELAEPPVQFR